MQVAQTLTQFDVDGQVESFIKDNNADLLSLCNKYYNDSLMGFSAFEESIRPILKDACITFANNQYQDNYLKPYLITVVLNFLKKEKEEVKKQTVHVCPACLYLGKETILIFSKAFRCHVCELELKSCDIPKKTKLLQTFIVHSKKGYKCKDCDRFIPHPLSNSENIICPYYDCCFSGTVDELKIMRHPSVTKRVEIISLDATAKSKSTNDKTNLSLKDSIASQAANSDLELEIKENFSKNLAVLKETIESQVNSLYYNSTDATLVHKLCMYQAFLNLIEIHPEDMISYLVLLNRQGGLQHKIFQEYVRLLEKKIPFTFKKGGKMYKVTSLLDQNLNIFEGISTFDAVVTPKKEIKNNTQEFYIGGRKCSYSKPYYIGKVLDIMNLSDGQSILDDMKSYSFSRIKLKNTASGTNVRVSHLRIPPHYQMGGMVHLNRLRRKIVDKVYFTLYGCKRNVNIQTQDSEENDEE